jgi:hypothetical protein
MGFRLPFGSVEVEFLIESRGDGEWSGRLSELLCLRAQCRVYEFTLFPSLDALCHRISLAVWVIHADKTLSIAKRHDIRTPFLLELGNLRSEAIVHFRKGSFRECVVRSLFRPFRGLPRDEFLQFEASQLLSSELN